jgi:hypothetical protein
MPWYGGAMLGMRTRSASSGKRRQASSGIVNENIKTPMFFGDLRSNAHYTCRIGNIKFDNRKVLVCQVRCRLLAAPDIATA